MAGAHQRQRERRFQHALHQHFDLAAARLAPEQPRLDHARVVEDEQVIAIEQFNDVAEVTVGEAPVRNVQQAARGAIGQRMLRDQSCGQIEIEICEPELAFGNGLTGHKSLASGVRDAARRTCTLGGLNWRAAFGRPGGGPHSKCWPRYRGAGKGNRTLTVLLPRDFESRASTSSAIPANSYFKERAGFCLRPLALRA